MLQGQTTTGHGLFQPLAYRKLRAAHLLMLRLSSDDLLKFGNSSLIIASRDGEDRLTKDLGRFI